jgi:hypothetical protein
MLTVFGDESADEKKERIFAVAGIMGTQEEWDKLAPRWLERTGGVPYHAADCESGYGDFKNLSPKERLRLHADLVRMLAPTKLVGFGVAMNIKAHKEVTGVDIDNIQYQNCFLKVVLYFAVKASIHIPPQKAKFIFDTNSETEASSIVLYDYMRNTDDFKFSENLFHEIAFAPHESHVGLQAADIVARETMKYFDNSFGRQRIRPERRSMTLLRSTKRYQFEYLDRREWENVKNSRKGLIKPGSYQAWRNEKKLPDNLIAMNRFLLETRGNRKIRP